ncbi:MAG: helix-turn-helix domain-containing protein [Elusimicrobiaceae bacterium]|nr:helix-turn-helix domain-containing protein [Elusimicrobiaceae bacterium]
MTRKKSEDIANKIRIFMLKNGISQRDLAKKMKVAPQTVSRFLTGENSFRTDTLEKISEALNVPANYFFSEVHGSAIGSNAQVNSSADIQKDIKLLSTQVELLTTKMLIIEQEIKALKKGKEL